MLVLEQLAERKKAELGRVNQLLRTVRGSDSQIKEWLTSWRSVLEQTSQTIVAWRNYTEINPDFDELDPNFDKFLEDIESQSAKLEEQLTKMEQNPGGSSNDDPNDDTPPYPERQEQNLTGEGTWSEPIMHTPQRPVPIGGHTLPPLPYPYNALEPHIDEQTMRLHHDKHHQSYVDGLNKAEKKMAEARRKNDFELIKHWEKEAAFNGAGHYLHTIFWDEMSPQGGGKPGGALTQQIASDFGSFDAFKKHFSQAAEKVEGGGWAILVWSPRSHRLEILQAEKHQNLSQWDVIPLLALDVWEHAYYLKYQNERARYIEAWWNVVNWPYVEQRFQEASKLKWMPY